MNNQSSHHPNRYRHQHRSPVLAGFGDSQFPPFKIRPDTPSSNEDIDLGSGKQHTPLPSAQSRGQVERKGLSQSNIANTMQKDISTCRREHSPDSDPHGVTGSQYDSDGPQKRRRLNVPDKEAETVLDENGFAILKKAILRAAKEAREGREEMCEVLKEIAKKLDNLALNM